MIFLMSSKGFRFHVIRRKSKSLESFLKLCGTISFNKLTCEQAMLVCIE